MLKILQSSQQDKLKRLLSVMLPIIGTQIATIGMNFFDASMSGQAGAVDLAGTAIGGNIWMPVQTGINGVLMAGMPLVAHLLGAGEKDKINIVVRHGLLLAIAFAVLVIIGGIIGLPLLLTHMGLEPEVYHVAIWYMAGIGFGVLPFFLVTPLRCLVDTLGYTGLTMKIYMLALPINAVLNYVLIFGKLGLPRLGGIGAGVATGITFWLLLGMFVLTLKKVGAFSAYQVLGLTKPQRDRVREYLKIGIPMGVSIFMESSIFGVVALFVAKFGTNVIAAHQAALNFSSLIYMIPLSFSLALTIVIGVEAGAKRWQDAKDYTVLGLELSMVCALVYISGEYFNRQLIAQIYSNSSEIMSLTVHFLIYAVLWQFFDAVAAPIQGVLRGYKDVNATFWSGMIAYWGICLPFGIFFDFVLEHGPFAYWQSLVIGVAFSAAFLSCRLLWLQKKLRQTA